MEGAIGGVEVWLVWLVSGVFARPQLFQILLAATLETGEDARPQPPWSKNLATGPGESW